MKNETLINPKITRTRNSVNVNGSLYVKVALITLFKLHQNEFFNTPLVYSGGFNYT
jgi:hypothetical protein